MAVRPLSPSGAAAADSLLQTMLEMLQAASEDLAANVVFGVAMLLAFALLFAGVAGTSIAVFRTGRWVARFTWNRLIVRAERRVFR